jgi:pimeloyl-ACP methyl ester carboxylesterase
MSAFFFGSAASPLFGLHHSPRSESVGAVLLCSPWGREYQYAHHAVRVLAKRLADRGFDVLRFDYGGTGDSWGETTDGRVSVWLDDIATAAEELRALSGRHEIHLVGLRLGALLAASAAARGAGFGRLVLWDPLVSGDEWVGSLQCPSPRPMEVRTATLELDGQLVARALADELRAVSIAQTAADFAASTLAHHPTLVLETQEPSSVLLEVLTGRPNVELRHVSDEAAWLEDPSIWHGLVPVKAINTIVEWMTQ